MPAPTVAYVGSSLVLSTAQTADTDSAVTLDRRIRHTEMAIILTTVDLGAGQTVTATLNGSVDGTNWYPIPYALVATPSTFVVAAITIATQTTITYLLQAGQAWRYLKVTQSGTVNMSLSATVYL